jgi:hypothetical protein
LHVAFFSRTPVAIIAGCFRLLQLVAACPTSSPGWEV